ncbi:MAG: T9SS type A sorting domain-containing protein [Bacteroidetes bacterium]|nr:T9SS type A sorting domain-containing protein [Bacteroidota bacterium]
MKKLFTILAFVVCISANAQVCFTTANYPAGQPYQGNTALACADFNSDGRLDLVTGFTNSSIIYFLPGNSIGGFGNSINVYENDTVPLSQLRFISGDFNGDGKADIAYPLPFGPNNGYIVILFGDGTGHFPTSNSFAVGSFPKSVCADDFNGDGKIDMAVANNSSHNISVLLGDGTGNFSTHTDFIAGSNMTEITSGDFNGDGNADLAASNSNNGGGIDSVCVLLGDGAGNFGTAAKYLAGSGPYSVCSNDFNGDGYDDIAVANWNSNNISVFLSKGTNGDFYPATNYATGSASNTVVSADFNGDGMPDLAVGNFTAAPDAVHILQNTGTGSFGPATVFPGSYGGWTIISADFNGDGKPDLATANHDSNNIAVLLNVVAPQVNISASGSLPICLGTSTTLTVSGSTTYTWSSNSGVSNLYDTITSAVITPLISDVYSIIGQKNGCKDSATISIAVVTPEVPNICMVTTDSASNYNFNVVCWDKTLYNNVDSFIVYRKDAISSNYLRLGAVSKNSLSEFVDTAFSIGGPNGGNPQYSSWFYKLAILDTCGNIGEESPYHQSMFVQENGSNFSWNAYTVETGQTNPITGYSFLRDDDNTGNWHVLVNTIGLSTTDPNYASYPDGNWRIDALGFNCTSSKNTQSTYLKSHSNTIKPVVMGIKQFILKNAQETIFPNPAANIVTLNIKNASNEGMELNIYSIMGVLVRSEILKQNQNRINIADLRNGIYIIEVKSKDFTVNQRLIIQK